MCKYFRNLFDYHWIYCLFLLAACCDVAVSLSRQCVLAGVDIKCSFPLISSLAFDVAIGTSWVSKQTLLFKVLLIIAAFHSVSFLYLSAFPVLERMSVLWVLCHAPNLQHSERNLIVSLAPCRSRTLLFAALPWCRSISVASDAAWRLLLWESLRGSYV